MPRSDSKTGIYLVLETENLPSIYLLNKQLSSDMVKKVCLHWYTYKISWFVSGHWISLTSRLPCVKPHSNWPHLGLHHMHTCLSGRVDVQLITCSLKFVWKYHGISLPWTNDLSVIFTSNCPMFMFTAAVSIWLNC